MKSQEQGPNLQDEAFGTQASASGYNIERSPERREVMSAGQSCQTTSPPRCCEDDSLRVEASAAIATAKVTGSFLRLWSILALDVPPTSRVLQEYGRSGDYMLRMV